MTDKYTKTAAELVPGDYFERYNQGKLQAYRVLEIVSTNNMTIQFKALTEGGDMIVNLMLKQRLTIIPDAQRRVPMQVHPSPRKTEGAIGIE